MAAQRAVAWDICWVSRMAVVWVAAMVALMAALKVGL